MRKDITLARIFKGKSSCLHYDITPALRALPNHNVERPRARFQPRLKLGVQATSTGSNHSTCCAPYTHMCATYLYTLKQTNCRGPNSINFLHGAWRLCPPAMPAYGNGIILSLPTATSGGVMVPVLNAVVPVPELEPLPEA